MFKDDSSQVYISLKTTVWFFRAVVLVLLVTYISDAQAKPLDILYTGCTNGVLENCRCPNDPFGALEKRTFEIDRRRKIGELILVDSGDFLSAIKDTIAAGFIIKAVELNGYDAITLGDQDLFHGRKTVEKILKTLPVVSANIAWDNGQLIAPPFRVVERSGQTFVITAITDPSTFKFIDPDLLSHIKLLDPDSSLKSVLKDIPKEAKVIVLSHSGYDMDKRFAAEWKNVDLIVGGHSQSKIDGVDANFGIPIVQSGGNARYLGTARLRRGKARAELMEIRVELPDDPRIIDLVMELRNARRKMRLNSD
jgi:2',3'-cyclic-nucleotide 2'-phosphodiesterase (5'-nucleotidase family)